MIFDITNKKKALKTLANYLHLEESWIEKYVDDHQLDYDAVHFLEDANIDPSSLSLDHLQLIGMHLTSNDDECLNIKKYGLQDLYHVLEKNLGLASFLKELGMSFDLNQQTFHYQDQIVSLLEPSWEEIKNKIYDQSVVHEFLRVGDFGYFSAKLQIRPEIITMLSQKFEDSNMASFWDLNHDTYLVKFVEDIEHFDYSSLAEHGLEKDVALQLIYFALDVIALNEHCEISCHLKKGHCILPEKIIDIHRFYNN